MGNWAQGYLRSLLSETDGTGSATRFCMILIVIFALGWVTGLVIHDKKLPDLGQVGGFVTLTCGSLYGINKAAQVVTSRSGGDNKP